MTIYGNVTWQWPKKKEAFPYKEVSRDIAAHKSSDLHFSNHCSTFILKNQLASFSYQHSISFTHGLQHYKNLGKTCLHRLCGFWQVSRQILTNFLVPNDSNYLDIKTKVFKREDKHADFRLRQNLTMAEADFNQFIRQRIQLVVAADNFLIEKNFPPVLQSLLSKDMEEQLKLVHKVTDVVRPRRRFVWHCWDTSWTTQTPLLLKFVYLDGGRRTKNFDKLCMSTINLTNLYIFLMSWIRWMIK